MNNREKPFSPATLADRWGVSDEIIRTMCKVGDLPSFKVRSMYRINAIDVYEYESCGNKNSIEENTTQSNTRTETQRGTPYVPPISPKLRDVLETF